MALSKRNKVILSSALGEHVATPADGITQLEMMVDVMLDNDPSAALISFLRELLGTSRTAQVDSKAAVDASGLEQKANADQAVADIDVVLAQPELTAR